MSEQATSTPEPSADLPASALAQKPLRSAIFTLALPVIAEQIFTSLTQIVDMAMVGGALPSGAFAAGDGPKSRFRLNPFGNGVLPDVRSVSQHAVLLCIQIRLVAGQHTMVYSALLGGDLPVISHNPIGLFDSGVGGLSVLRELRAQLPRENVVYFADTLHMPYGPRSPQELRQLVFAILDFLQRQSVKLVIMACNTSSALVLHLARGCLSLPILGMIEPTAQLLAQAKPAAVGILATEATVRSGKYAARFRAAGVQGRIVTSACPELASLIEAGDDPAGLVAAVEQCVQPLRQAAVDPVVLGCTHYPFASRQIASALGYPVQLVDPAQPVVAEARRLLHRLDLLNPGTGPAEQVFYVSGSLPQFEQRAARLLGYPVTARPAAFESADGRLQVTK